MITGTVLALDPTLNNLGFAVMREDDILECGVIRAPGKMSKAWGAEMAKANRAGLKSFEISLRAAIVFSRLCDIAKRHEITSVFAECPAGAQNSSGAMSMEKASGGIICLSRMLSVPLVLVTPGEVKRLTAGHTDAGKDSVMEWAQRRFPTIPVHITAKASDFEHVADALAVYWVIKYCSKNNSRVMFIP